MTRVRSLILGALLAGPGASTSWSRTIFVAPDGSDAAGTGERERPLRSLTTALGMAVSGDTVEARAGTYREPGEIRFRNPGVTLRAHAGERVILAGPLDAEETHSACVWIDPDAHHTTLSGLEITGGWYYGITLETKWDWGDPSDRSGASHVVIEDCRIHDTGRDAIKIKPNCDDITIRRCEIFRTGVGPANTADPNAEGIDCVNGDRVLIQDCDIHDIHSTGIYLKGGSTDAVVERCRVTRCGEGGILLGFDTSPEFFDLAANPAYHENIRGTIRHCVIRETGWEGIGMYAALQPRILGNTLVDVCQRRVHAAIYFGLSYQDWDPEAGRPSSSQPVIQGNLVLQPTASSAPIVEIRHSEDLGGLSALAGWPDMEFNGYHVAGPGGAVFTDQRPGTGFERIRLAEWRTAAGADRQSLEGDPILLAHAALGVPWSSSLPRAGLIDTDRGRVLGFNLVRDPGLTGMTVEVLAADDPAGPWTPIATSAHGQPYTGAAVGAETRLPNGLHRVAIQDAMPTDAVGSRFLRIRVRR